MSCLLITLNKCLKGHKSLGLLLGGVLKMSLSLSLSLSLYLSLSFFLVMSCLLITLNKCLKGHKSLGWLLGGVLKMSLSLSFHNFFQDIPLDEQKSRDDDYNLKLNQLADRSLLYFPGNQMIRAWNSNNLLIKSEADCTTLKENFKQNKLDLYEDDCLKPNCYVFNLDY